MYVYSGSMVTVSRHHKSRRVTNHEFQVARFLPDRVGRLLYVHLVYVWPFSDLLRRQVYYGSSIESPVLFVSCVRPEKAWRTAVLSARLKSSATRVAGLAVAVRVYRQISIAITERHIQHISKPFNQHDDRTKATTVDSVYT